MTLRDTPAHAACGARLYHKPRSFASLRQPLRQNMTRGKKHASPTSALSEIREHLSSARLNQAGYWGAAAHLP